jgi:hypothetical protein
VLRLEINIRGIAPFLKSLASNKDINGGLNLRSKRTSLI